MTRPTNVRHLALAALLVITAVNYAQRNCIGPAKTTIEESIQVTPVQLDLAGGAFFFAYTLLQVPSGWLAKLWGPRVALSLYAAGWSGALACLAAATGFTGLLVGRLILGALQAGIFPCATLILASWYPASLRGTATALLNSFMLFGDAAGGVLCGQLLEPDGPLTWQGVFLLYSVPGFVWAVLFYLWFRDRPEDHSWVNLQERELLASDRPEAPRDQVPLGVSLVAALAVPLLLLYTQQMFRAAAPRLFEDRLPTYYEKELGRSKGEAANLSSWPKWLGMVGGLLGGMASDLVLRRTGSLRLARNGVAIASLVVALAWYVPAYYVEDVYVATALLAVGSFFFNVSSPCAYALCIDMGGRHLPVVFGLMNMVGNLGAWVFVSSVMWMVSIGGWPLAFSVWALLHVAAILCWLFLDSERKIE